MILQLFTWLSGTLHGTPGIALAGAFLWGICSILLSPCHLASIPLIVGFINGQGRVTAQRGSLIALLFSAGILLTIAAIGLLTSLLGRMLGDTGPWGSYAVAAVFFVVGLHLMGVVDLPMPASARQPSPGRKGLLAAFVLGLVFGIALGPCTFAFMMPVLGAAFSAGRENAAFGASLVLAYGAGHVSVIIGAGTFTPAVQSYLNWQEHSRGPVLVRKACGVLVFAAGFYFLTR